MCRKNMWVALAVAAVLAIAVSPGTGAIWSFLVIAACPLMMLVAGTGILGLGRRDRAGSSAPGDNEVAALRAEVAELRERVNR